jgi:uncharacterized protein YdcH (DUF465 family)
MTYDEYMEQVKKIKAQAFMRCLEEYNEYLDRVQTINSYEQDCLRSLDGAFNHPLSGDERYFKNE